MSKIRLALGIPAYGGKIVAEQARMWMELGNVLGGSPRFELAWQGYIDVNPISKARNQIASEARSADADWLFSIDADTWVEGDSIDDAGVMILRMISEAERAGAWLVSAPVVKRSTEADADALAIYDTSGDTLRRFGRIAQQQQLIDINAVGAACFAVDLEKTKDIKYRFVGDLSEDLDFCRTIRNMDGRVMVDPRVTTAHLSRPFPLRSHAT